MEHAEDKEVTMIDPSVQLASPQINNYYTNTTVQNEGLNTGQN